MYLVLTDLLTCPRCGPTQGLIVLADQTVERRVIEGRLGCPQCETQYPIHDGIVDLRTDRTADPPTVDGEVSEPVRLAAMLGIMPGSGYVLLAGVEATRAEEIAAMIPGLEVIAIGPVTVRDGRGVSRLQIDGGFPLHGASMRTLLVGTGVPEQTARDALRVAAVGARIVFAAEHGWVAESISSGILRLLVRDSQYIVTIRVL